MYKDKRVEKSKMPNYQNGKIYKITSGELTYIGSTCEPTLARRLSKHIGHYNMWKKDNRGYTTSFQLIETGQYEITLIELFPCGSKDELTARERFHIETNVCVNKFIPTRTKEEYAETYKEYFIETAKKYYEVNKERKKEKSKEWRSSNKERIAERNKAYYLKKKLQTDTCI